MEKEIRCAFCVGMLPEGAKTCPECDETILRCIVCLLSIVQGDEFVKCPHCGSFSHRSHLIEWIKIIGIYPRCRERLTEFDIPS